MFDKIGNLPLHPLVVHTVVIGVPLAVLLAFLFAFPKTREWARWPLAIVVVGATVVTFVAKQSGLAFETALGIKPGNPVGDLILKHSLLANQLFYIMIVLPLSACSTCSWYEGAPLTAPMPASSPQLSELCCRCS